MKQSTSINIINADGGNTKSASIQRESSPLTRTPRNTVKTRESGTASTSPNRLRSSCSTPLPHIELDKTTIDLIKENEQMMFTISSLQHELSKKQLLLDRAEGERRALADEVANLRNQLGMATSKVTTSTGQLINYKEAYTDLQHTYDMLKEDSEATKEKLEEATRRERLFMQNAPKAQQNNEMHKVFESVTGAMIIPNRLLASIEDIMKKLHDPALRPADRPLKLKDDINHIESRVNNYNPGTSSSAAVPEGDISNLDIPIRQCVYSLLSVITTLLKDAVRK